MRSLQALAAEIMAEAAENDDDQDLSSTESQWQTHSWVSSLSEINIIMADALLAPLSEALGESAQDALMGSQQLHFVKRIANEFRGASGPRADGCARRIA